MFRDDKSVRVWKDPESSYLMKKNKVDMETHPSGNSSVIQSAVNGAAGSQVSPLLTISLNCDTVFRGTCGGFWTVGCCPK